jgi:hypothetical protein
MSDIHVQVDFLPVLIQQTSIYIYYNCSNKIDKDNYKDINKINNDNYNNSSNKTDTVNSSDNIHSFNISKLNKYRNLIKKYKSFCYKDICF